MARELMLYMHFRENESRVSVWKRCIDGIEVVSIERYLGTFDYGVIEA